MSATIAKIQKLSKERRPCLAVAWGDGGRCLGTAKKFISEGEIGYLCVAVENIVYGVTNPGCPPLGSPEKTRRKRFSFQATDEQCVAFDRALSDYKRFLMGLVGKKDDFIIDYNYILDCFRHYFMEHIEGCSPVAHYDAPLLREKQPQLVLSSGEADEVEEAEAKEARVKAIEAIRAAKAAKAAKEAEAVRAADAATKDIPSTMSESFRTGREQVQSEGETIAGADEDVQAKDWPTYRPGSRDTRDFANAHKGARLKNIVTGGGALLMPSGRGSGLMVIYLEKVRDVFCIGPVSSVVDDAYIYKRGVQKKASIGKTDKDISNPANMYLTHPNHWHLVDSGAYVGCATREQLVEIVEWASKHVDCFASPRLTHTGGVPPCPILIEYDLLLQKIGEDIKHIPPTQCVKESIGETRIAWSIENRKKKAAAKADAKARAEDVKKAVIPLFVAPPKPETASSHPEPAAKPIVPGSEGDRIADLEKKIEKIWDVVSRMVVKSAKEG